ncbi:MAG: BamA/TamA family outer membrane protein [Cyanobacteria bacterium]|nr:BamA/TamA family outer membrane protein [Cyanobacteriota bacterium]
MRLRFLCLSVFLALFQLPSLAASVPLPIQANPGYVTPTPQTQLVPPPAQAKIRLDIQQLDILNDGVDDPIKSGPYQKIILEQGQYRLFSEEEIEQITRPFLDKVLSPEDLLKLRLLLNKQCQEKGYITTHVVLKPHNEVPEHDDGGPPVLRLFLQMGTLKAIEVSAKHQLPWAAWSVRGLLKARINEDAPINIHALQETIDLLNQQSPYRLEATLKSDGLSVEAKQPNPWQISPFFDNQGRPYIGTLREGFTVSNQNLLGLGDRLSATPFFARGTRGVITRYSLPVGPRGDEVAINYTFNRVDALFRPRKTTDVDAHTFVYTITYAHPWDRYRHLVSTIGFNYRNNDVLNNDVTLTHARTNFVVFGQNFNYNDRWGQTSGRVEVAVGEANNHRGTIVRNTNTLQRTINLPYRHQLSLRALAQFTQNTLPISQDVQIGGAYSVRGFSEGVREGDQGYIINLEDRFPIPGLKRVSPWLDDRLRGVVFLDAAQAFLDRNSPRFRPGVSNRFDRNSLLSTGFGLRARLTRFSQGFIDVGFGLVDRAHLEPYGQPSARVHFGIRSDLLPQVLR